MNLPKALISITIILACQMVRAADDPQHRLEAYRAELNTLRTEHGGSHDLPDEPFFLFGMGGRSKLIYRAGELIDAIHGNTVRKWAIAREWIVPCDYAVTLQTPDDSEVRIYEDERAVWVQENARNVMIDGTNKPLRLPTFDGRQFPLVMRVLHQEILVNIIDGKPVPNYFVYPRPWYRDGAMMAMCLRDTGNLDQIRDWVNGLREPYDRNNAGQSEPDNLGEALFLISLVSDRRHPLVGRILDEMSKRAPQGHGTRYVSGKTDFSPHPAYQTKWAKYGLNALRLDDAYAVPRIADSYSALFWMDYKDAYAGKPDANDNNQYPYLGWACAHFHGAKPGVLSSRDYPLTWEQNASQADYPGIRRLSAEYARQRLAAPHTWHAAEAFLYLNERAAATPR